MHYEEKQDITEMNTVEYKAHWLPVTEQAVNMAKEQESIFSYPANAVKHSLVVREYWHGRRVLVSIDTSTGREQFVREL